jgi:hypothetical protein
MTVESVSHNRTNLPSQDTSALHASVVWLEYISYWSWNSNGPASLFETSNNYKVLLLRNHYYFFVTFVIHRQTLLQLLHIFRNPTPKFDPLLGVIWSPVTKDGLRYLNIDKELTMQNDLAKDRVAFWEELQSSLWYMICDIGYNFYDILLCTMCVLFCT